MGFGWIKVHYVLLYVVIGAYLPYMPIFLNERGLADWQIGWVLGVYGLAVMVMPVAMTHLADRRVTNRALIRGGYLVAAVTLAGVALADGFAALLLLSLLFSIGYTPMFSLTDGMTFTAMHEAEEAGRRPPRYHTIRIWGSIGFMLPAVVLFALLRFTALPTAAAVVTAACAALLAVLTAQALPAAGPRAVEAGAPLPSADAWRVIRRQPVLALVGPLVLMFLAISIFYAFYSRYLQELGVGSEWVGLIVNIGVLAEVLLMLAAGWMLHHFGVKGLMVLGAVCMVVRLALLAGVPTVGVAIWTQLLHAPIVLALYLVPPMYLNLKAGRTYRNSMQGLYGVLCFGAARLTGSVLGGYIAQVDLRLTFAAGAGLSLVATGWLLLGFGDRPASAALRQLSAVRAPAHEP